MSRTAQTGITVAILACIAIGLREIGTDFALGFLAGVVLFQVAHRIRDGYWF